MSTKRTVTATHDGSGLFHHTVTLTDRRGKHVLTETRTTSDSYPESCYAGCSHGGSCMRFPHDDTTAHNSGYCRWFGYDG